MYERGTVVVASDPFGNTPKRPYLVCSDETHPFAGEQYIVLGITTKAYADSIPLSGAFVAGSLAHESFLSPWAIVSILEKHVDRAVARIAEDTITEALQRAAGYVGVR
ncbi:hypothetical protein [Natronomonas salsuginis]|uniref:Type II toxin-antitoxin system PemK/MazF family toxin n=1 Tax=Natronomonas salsuginis TaxID=2217661 RepID=A0A4U5JC71_9EURY|nr:hypothetical protein [Natronomonas salsuginis]TKR25438.1 hypothetical protein DM868_08410 [Natronomonas salsuginis]